MSTVLGWQVFVCQLQASDPNRKVVGSLRDPEAAPQISETLNRYVPETSIRHPKAEIFISRAVDGRFSPFQSFYPRRHLPGDDRGDFQRSNCPNIDSVVDTITHPEHRSAAKIVEVDSGDVGGQSGPFQVHNIKEHDVYEPCTKFGNSILLLSMPTT